MASSVEYDDERLRSLWAAAGASEPLLEACALEANELEDVADEADDGIVEIRRSLPRPLMPLLEFL